MYNFGVSWWIFTQYVPTKTRIILYRRVNKIYNFSPRRVSGSQKYNATTLVSPFLGVTVSWACRGRLMLIVSHPIMHRCTVAVEQCPCRRR